VLLERERRGGVGERCCFGGEGGGVDEDDEDGEGEGEPKRDA
jgi:hypothetical protein